MQSLQKWFPWSAVNAGMKSPLFPSHLGTHPQTKREEIPTFSKKASSLLWQVSGEHYQQHHHWSCTQESYWCVEVKAWWSILIVTCKTSSFPQILLSNARLVWTNNPNIYSARNTLNKLIPYISVVSYFVKQSMNMTNSFCSVII